MCIFLVREALSARLCHGVRGRKRGRGSGIVDEQLLISHRPFMYIIQQSGNVIKTSILLFNIYSSPPAHTLRRMVIVGPRREQKRSTWRRGHELDTSTGSQLRCSANAYLMPCLNICHGSFCCRKRLPTLVSVFSAFVPHPAGKRGLMEMKP